ncbi:hypothetical protein [Rhodococcus sp. 1168]|uniref:TA system antitoxin ParD family protein n=1 Tax=Rhodococcus sp. 1168 TaxID=2018041 RepID=UPI000A0AE648|nr:hypothetical protein [Rhodococcus sp. 1168]ORI21182.1 hypothetical protein BJI47_17235 [Rhodococcus sp. 1168]
METTSSMRINDDLYAAAKQAGAAAGRSAAQQIAHWAVVGREIEKSHNVTTRDFADVLAGSKTYDSLSVPQQAVVRAEWTERIEALTQSLDCEAEFTAEQRPYVEADQNGKVLHKGPGLDRK